MGSGNYIGFSILVYLSAVILYKSWSPYKVFISHCFYNLKINLEEGAQPLISTIYSFLASKQEALKKFIEENMNIRFIWPTFLPHNALVNFVNKKDELLHLYFCGLDCITKKNCYPLLFISYLLDSPYKA